MSERGTVTMHIDDCDHTMFRIVNGEDDTELIKEAARWAAVALSQEEDG